MTCIAPQRPRLHGGMSAFWPEIHQKTGGIWIVSQKGVTKKKRHVIIDLVIWGQIQAATSWGRSRIGLGQNISSQYETSLFLREANSVDTCTNLPPTLDQLLSTQPYEKMTQLCEFLTEDDTVKNSGSPQWEKHAVIFLKSNKYNI